MENNAFDRRLFTGFKRLLSVAGEEREFVIASVTAPAGRSIIKKRVVWAVDKRKPVQTAQGLFQADAIVSFLETDLPVTPEPNQIIESPKHTKYRILDVFQSGGAIHLMLLKMTRNSP